MASIIDDLEQSLQTNERGHEEQERARAGAVFKQAVCQRNHKEAVRDQEANNDHANMLIGNCSKSKKTDASNGICSSGTHTAESRVVLAFMPAHQSRIQVQGSPHSHLQANNIARLCKKRLPGRPRRAHMVAHSLHMAGAGPLTRCPCARTGARRSGDQSAAVKRARQEIGESAQSA